MSDFDDEHMEDQQRHYISKLKKIAIVTIHDACPAFSTKIFNLDN
jgi:hypothetical protein